MRRNKIHQPMDLHTRDIELTLGKEANTHWREDSINLEPFSIKDIDKFVDIRIDKTDLDHGRAYNRERLEHETNKYDEFPSLSVIGLRKKKSAKAKKRKIKKCKCK
jgi:hypothetical protein